MSPQQLPHRPTPAMQRSAPLTRILYPFRRFFEIEASSGVVLLICAVVALAWANSPYGDTYRRILETPVSVGFGEHRFTLSALHWINDALMAVFFLVVGLEIKRELVGGELADTRKAAFPAAAAVGGMVVPALIYVAFNAGTPDIRGWGVPMATDIAFAVGVMTLLGTRIPFSLKVFLTALAIVDDIGAVVVIALFYGHSVVWSALGIGVVLLLVSALLGGLGLRSPIAYGLIGIAVWAAFLKSGVHSTVAGVLLAFTIPATTRLDADSFRKRVQKAIDDFGRLPANSVPTLAAEQQAAIAELERACEEVQPPLQRIEHMLQPWVSFGIMPIFALANSGVHISGIKPLEHFGVPVGVALGLLVGKPVGITLVAWVATKIRWGDGPLAVKPDEMTWRHIFGAGMLAGIGFTMALFIAGLAFRDANTLAAAKLALLLASAVSGTAGYLYLRRIPQTHAEPMP